MLQFEALMRSLQQHELKWWTSYDRIQSSTTACKWTSWWECILSCCFQRPRMTSAHTQYVYEDHICIHHVTACYYYYFYFFINYNAISTVPLCLGCPSLLYKYTYIWNQVSVFRRNCQNCHTKHAAANSPVYYTSSLLYASGVRHELQHLIGSSITLPLTTHHSSSLFQAPIPSFLLSYKH